MATLVSGAIFLFVLLFVFLYHNDGYQSHIEYTKGVRNYDLNMRAFCYRTDMSVAEVWDALERNNTYTALKYRFDAQRGVITFYDALTKGRGEISYRVCVAPCGDKTAVKIVQLDPSWKKNEFLYYQNEFWQQKLGAEPIPYISAEEWEKR